MIPIMSETGDLRITEYGDGLDITNVGEVTLYLVNRNDMANPLFVTLEPGETLRGRRSDNWCAATRAEALSE